MIFTCKLLIFQLSIDLLLPSVPICRCLLKISCFHFLLVYNLASFNARLCSGFSEEPCIIFASSPYKESLSVCVAWFLTVYRFIEFPEFQKDTNWFFMLPGRAILNFCLFLPNNSLVGSISHVNIPDTTFLMFNLILICGCRYSQVVIIKNSFLCPN